MQILRLISFVSQRSTIIAISLTLTAGLSACKLKTNRGDLQGLSNDSQARNVAVLFSDRSNISSATSIDTANMASLIGKFARQDQFHTISRAYASRAEIISLTQSAAQKVDDSGTLLWYFSGHGDQAYGGSIYPSAIERVTYQQIAKTIASVRKRPIKRLVMIVDACFSGNLINPEIRNDTAQESAVVTQENFRSSFAAVKLASGAPLFEQVIIMTSTRADTISYVDEQSPGSIFTNALIQTYGEFYDAHVAEPGRSVRISDLLSTVQRRGVFKKAHPVTVAFPESTYLDFLFDVTGNDVEQENNGFSRNDIKPLVIPSNPEGDDDGDGITNSKDRCPQTPAGSFVYKTQDKMNLIGCAAVESPASIDRSKENAISFGDDDGDGILNWADRCSRTDGLRFNIFTSDFHGTNLGASEGYIGCASSDEVDPSPDDYV